MYDLATTSIIISFNFSRMASHDVQDAAKQAVIMSSRFSGSTLAKCARSSKLKYGCKSITTTRVLITSGRLDSTDSAAWVLMSASLCLSANPWLGQRQSYLQPRFRESPGEEENLGVEGKVCIVWGYDFSGEATQNQVSLKWSTSEPQVNFKRSPKETNMLPNRNMFKHSLWENEYAENVCSYAACKLQMGISNKTQNNRIHIKKH